MTVGDPKVRAILAQRFPELSRALSPKEWDELWRLVQRGDFTDQGLLDLTPDLLLHNLRIMFEHRPGMDQWIKQFMETSTQTQLLAQAIQAVQSEPGHVVTPHYVEDSDHVRNLERLREERESLWTESVAKYREKCGDLLTQAIVAKQAGWKDRTLVGWWKRCDPRSTPDHDRKIRTALKALLA